MNYRKEATD